MNQDDDLWKRFNALKAPQHDVGEYTSPKDIIHAKSAAGDIQDDDLEAIADGRRFPAPDRPGPNDLHKTVNRLKGEDKVDEVDDEVEAYLANLAAASAPETAPDDIDSLVAAIRDSRRGDIDNEARQALGHAAQITARENASETALEGTEDPPETEEEIIARALEEAALESSSPKVAAVDDTDAFAFPTLPTHVPVDNTPDPDIDEDTKKRLDLLLGLSGPTQKPGQASLPTVPKRAPGQGWNLPGYNDARDEDLDSWCCICNKDADVICLGCDNDPYCTSCWTKGHEFEKHRTKRFTWNRESGA